MPGPRLIDANHAGDRARIRDAHGVRSGFVRHAPRRVLPGHQPQRAAGRHRRPQVGGGRLEGPGVARPGLREPGGPPDPADRPGARADDPVEPLERPGRHEVHEHPARERTRSSSTSGRTTTPETFSIALDGREVVHDFDSGPAGTWKRLGPWRVVVDSGSIRLTTRGGAANLSGIEIWKGDGPIPEPGRPKARPARPRDPAAARVFDAEIAPILARHCLECHGRSLQKGKLALRRKTPPWPAARADRSSCRASRRRACCCDYVDSGEMPRDRPPLSDAEKQRLRRWIADGAKWGTPEIDPFLATTDRRAGYDWWSLQPVRDPAPPAVRDARLAPERHRPVRPRAARGAGPASRARGRPADADPAALLRPDRPAARARGGRAVRRRHRRQTPTRSWSTGCSPRPTTASAGRRHWLDVVRFGESEGFERNHIRDNAWRYRDWVVQAFNRDLPYDEFVRQQIAGDVLHPDDLEALIATGYHVCGTWDEVAHYEGSSEMQKATRFDELEDLVGTLGQTFLGLTINCARCHDHKFDPISQKEYYQVAALLGGREPGEGGAIEDHAGRDPRPARLRRRRARRSSRGNRRSCRRPGAGRLPQARRGRLPRGPEGALRACRPTSAWPRMPPRPDGARPWPAG